MSKKSEIIVLFNKGVSTEEIAKLGYKKDYINRVLRENTALNTIIKDKKNKIAELEELISFLKNNLDTIKDIEFKFKINFVNDKITTKKEEVINPIEIYRLKGEIELKNMLGNLNVEELKKISKKYAPDPRKIINRSKNKEKIVEYLMKRTKSIAETGSVFVDETLSEYNT